ncbi:MAG: isopeptide-forming domain-containing fimbrial protein [Polyangiaceae bacterium]|nr:isopeptide-forming domain-containing fimbrial protein [Polyangiaceae bacterium]
MFRARIASILAFLTAAPVAAAATPEHPPKLRHQADLQGDAVVIGSTLAFDCAAGMPAAPAGAKVSCSGVANVADTAPDLYWRDNVASNAILPNKARTSATLELPAGAKVQYARLYWGALHSGTKADTTVTVDHAGGVPTVITADDSWTTFYGFTQHPDWYYYQSTADVTQLVSQWTAPDFRVTDVDAIEMANADAHLAFSAWTLVVFYQRTGDELRNLALFDGFTHVAPEFGLGAAAVTLSGFLVPSGYTARMTAFTYEGDTVYSGDKLLFNGQHLTSTGNPKDNFFNGSRSFLGKAVSGASDVPKLSGAPGTMGGYDLDTVDVTSLVKAGDKSAKLSAESAEDKFLLGGFVTSITNLSPDFPDFDKVATDLDGGVLLENDQVEYVLTSTNSGNDAAVGTVWEDVLDQRLELVPASLQSVENGVVIPLSHAAGDDRGEYDAATRTLRVRLGAGADALKGGKLAVGEGFEIRFRVKVKAGIGESIPNQGSVTASGLKGGAKKTWLSDGDPLTPGAQPTTVTVDECGSNLDCPANKPFCELSTHTCQPCSSDEHCTDPNFPACQPDGSCGECSAGNTSKCPSSAPVCVGGKCAACTPGPNAPECQNDPNGPVCLVNPEPVCGCDTDDDCGGAQSGRICENDKCVDGCRGEGGNGCPTGESCSSTTAAPGVCGEIPPPPPATAAPADSDDDGGCGCALPGQSRSRGALAALGALVLGLGLRRRRSR